jgi:hypothetical protein
MRVEAGLEQPELGLKVLMRGRRLALQASPQRRLFERALGVAHVETVTQTACLLESRPSRQLSEGGRGSRRADLASLPGRKAETYDHAHKSRIFALDLKERKPIES